MMNTGMLLLTIVMSFVCLTLATDLHPCSLIRCAECHRCELHSGNAKCMLNPKCPGCTCTEEEKCRVDPCHQFEQRCPGATTCRSLNCPGKELGCHAVAYDAAFNVVECNPLPGELTCPENQARLCSAPAPIPTDPAARDEGTVYPTVYYYCRYEGACKAVEGVCKETGYTLNTFDTLDACQKTCDPVGPCPELLPGCKLLCPPTNDNLGCPATDCADRIASGCGGTLSESPCPPCHTCHPNYDPTQGYCCIKNKDPNCVARLFL